jgi:hypothetical protein
MALTDLQILCWILGLFPTVIEGYDSKVSVSDVPIVQAKFCAGSQLSRLQPFAINRARRRAFAALEGPVLQQMLAERTQLVWVALAWLLTEEHFRKVIGHEHLWALAVILQREENSRAAAEKVA